MSKYLIVKRTRLNFEDLIVIYFEDLIVIYFENLIVICFERVLIQICFVIEKSEFFGCMLLKIQKKNYLNFNRIVNQIY